MTFFAQPPWCMINGAITVRGSLHLLEKQLSLSFKFYENVRSKLSFRKVDALKKYVIYMLLQKRWTFVNFVQEFGERFRHDRDGWRIQFLNDSFYPDEVVQLFCQLLGELGHLRLLGHQVLARRVQSVRSSWG